MGTLLRGGSDDLPEHRSSRFIDLFSAASRATVSASHKPGLPLRVNRRHEAIRHFNCFWGIAGKNFGCIV